MKHWWLWVIVVGIALTVTFIGWVEPWIYKELWTSAATLLLAFATFALVVRSVEEENRRKIETVLGLTENWALRVAIIAHDIEDKSTRTLLEIERDLQECWEHGKTIGSEGPVLLKVSVNRLKGQLQTAINTISEYRREYPTGFRFADLKLNFFIVRVGDFTKNASIDEFRTDIIKAVNNILSEVKNSR